MNVLFAELSDTVSTDLVDMADLPAAGRQKDMKKRNRLTNSTMMDLTSGLCASTWVALPDWYRSGGE